MSEIQLRLKIISRNWEEEYPEETIRLIRDKYAVLQQRELIEYEDSPQDSYWSEWVNIPID